MEDILEKVSNKNVFLYYCNCCDYKCNKKSMWDKHILTAKHQKNEKVEKDGYFVEEVSKKNQRLFYCNCCNYICSTKFDLDKHILTSKHKNNEKVEKVSKKIMEKYYCEYCNHTSSNEYNYNKHIMTSKHQKNEKKKSSNYKKENVIVVSNEFCIDNIKTNNLIMQSLEKVGEKVVKENNYKNTDNYYANGNDYINNDTNKLFNIILEVVKNNSDFQKQMFDFVKTSVGYNNNNNITTNSHNKAFNLNFFLNETCKNAMNISDFVESLQPQLSDLECIGDLGYVEGISKIIVKSLKALDETERPIHCTDKKRETFYIKDDDKWEKEDDNKTHIRNAIKYIADKNTLLVPQWKAKYPDYKDSSSIYSDKYNNMIIEVLGGDDNTEQSENKIIRKIAKEVVIDK